jgi:BirA family biotin operon repressor/biotin-[acetyl-CoA-carboxylase] ligase
MDTLFLGQNLIELDVVDSTNNYAANLLNTTNVHDGTVILAYHQEKGRGQRGNIWHSVAHTNLTISIVLYAKFLTADRQFMLSKAISLGIFDYLDAMMHKPVYVKWPNDIYVGDSKIAGILIENSLRANYVTESIVGIGLNVNQQQFKPEYKATSIAIEAGREQLLDVCLNGLCLAIEKRYLQLKTNKYQLLNDDYLKHLMNYNIWQKYEWEGQMINACIRDVDEEGKLVLERENGTIISCGMKEIVFVL